MTNDELSKKFHELKEEWQKETACISSPTEIYMHDAYQQIIGLGPQAVPLILAEIRDEAGFWHWALHAMTRANPIPDDFDGGTQEIAELWLEWEEQNLKQESTIDEIWTAAQIAEESPKIEKNEEKIHRSLHSTKLWKHIVEHIGNGDILTLLVDSPDDGIVDRLNDGSYDIRCDSVRVVSYPTDLIVLYIEVQYGFDMTSHEKTEKYELRFPLDLFINFQEKEFDILVKQSKADRRAQLKTELTLRVLEHQDLYEEILGDLEAQDYNDYNDY